MTATEDTQLRQAVHQTLQCVQPRPAPLEVIIRRGRRIRRRRAGAAVGGLGLAAVLAVAALTLQGRHQQGPAGRVVPSGVFASGTVDGHAWRLAVQNIADPGYPCLPGITINGTDADWVYPDPGSRAAVALGQALPGVGFGFIQLPAGLSGVTVNGLHHVQAVTVAACGDRYHLVGFAYSLAEPLRVTAANPPPGWPAVFLMPVVTTQPPGKDAAPENPGLWVNTDSTPGATASGTLASGSLSGQQWRIWLMLGTGGDCYGFNGGGNQMGSCAPVSVPTGPETIVALPLGFPSGAGATGYALEVSPGTAHLKAVLSDGSVLLVTPRVMSGRKYAAFIVPGSLRLTRLIWLDARGRIIASTTALPPYGYVQVQP